jgi:hypothetical protein
LAAAQARTNDVRARHGAAAATHPRNECDGTATTQQHVATRRNARCGPVHRVGAAFATSACARNRYADFALFHVLDATAAQFDTPAYGHAWAKADVPALKAFYAWMRERRAGPPRWPAAPCRGRCCRLCAAWPRRVAC